MNAREALATVLCCIDSDFPVTEKVDKAIATLEALVSASESSETGTWLYKKGDKWLPLPTPPEVERK